MSETLSRALLAEVERLGGSLGTKVVVIDPLPPGVVIRAPMAQLFAIEWPAEYAADESGTCWWAQRVHFHAPSYCDRIDFGFDDRGGAMELVRFCHARQRYFIMLDLHDADPGDPLVYHASSGTYTPVLGSGIRLSAFLAALEPITTARAGGA